MRRSILTLSAVLLLPAAPAFAQKDEPDCKDIPLFNRMPGHYIARCESSPFEQRKFPVGPVNADRETKLVEVEGPWTLVVYRPAEGTPKTSPLQIQRNFEAAAKKAGGTVEGSYPEWCKMQLDESFKFGNTCTDRGSTLRFAKDGKELWVFVNGTAMPHTGYEDGYAVMMSEREALTQDIVANDLFEKISKDGMVALYLNFDTASAVIQPTSDSQLDEIATMLKSNASLSVEVAGHTDNVGTPEANMKLSDARAQAVMKALVTRGVPAARLSAKGFGQSQPIADNRTEDGRAKNRRVELVKK